MGLPCRRDRQVLTIGREQPQILNLVVLWVAVDVVHNLLWKERSTQVFLHHQTMFPNVPTIVRLRMSRATPKEIPGFVHYHTPTPSRIPAPVSRQNYPRPFQRLTHPRGGRSKVLSHFLQQLTLSNHLSHHCIPFRSPNPGLQTWAILNRRHQAGHPGRN